jgi:hypothetical protein
MVGPALAAFLLVRPQEGLEDDLALAPLFAQALVVEHPGRLPE